MPSKTFDNVKGEFPIGFKVWHLTANAFPFTSIAATVYDEKGNCTGTKTLRPEDDAPRISSWIRRFLAPSPTQPIGYTGNYGPDFQHNHYLRLHSTKRLNRNGTLDNSTKYPIGTPQLLPICIYFAVRLCIAPTWLNDRDQFYWPHDSWRDDAEFQRDCLAFTLLHGQNRISCAEGSNHWIPYTEYEVDAKEKFSSHFMVDFLSGKLGRKEGDTGDLFTESVDLIPKEPVVFSPEAQAVLDAGRALWRYYHAQPNANPNAALYDIRLHFQGSKPNGHMNPKSDDASYTELIGILRERLKALARKIEPKVYAHGFLLG